MAAENSCRKTLQMFVTEMTTRIAGMVIFLATSLVLSMMFLLDGNALKPPYLVSGSFFGAKKNASTHCRNPNEIQSHTNATKKTKRNHHF